MRIQIISTLFFVSIILSCCNNRSIQQDKKGNATIEVQSNTSYGEKEKVSENKMLSYHWVDAEREGIYDVFDNDFKYLEDSLKNILFNTTVSFYGDTIIINKNQKVIFSRRTVATKNIFRQCEYYQKMVFKYFGKRAINVSDSIDYFLLSDYSDNFSAFTYNYPGIIYERPYLLVPFNRNFIISFIVDIEPTKNNRVMPERRKKYKSK